ncbi:hypothetical protein RhiirA5_439951 [Rhizophagus irregularis]|uniref:Uncharacterized protein n=1 Tax=Rhizophagus irregularis TaxID=588596 RepID=A0A2N0NHC6_9GLOM|nr:hypothetical protein RhiirA5_439951 [Rhizophagus irregularis]
MDNKWVIHGKQHDCPVKIASKEVTARTLISTSPGKNNKVIPVNNQDSAIATPNTVLTTTTEEVVDTVNKFRKNLLHEVQVSTVSVPIKEYTSLKKVVKIIERYGDEIFVEHEIAPVKEGILVDLSVSNEKTIKSVNKVVKPRSKLNEIMMEYERTSNLIKEKIVSPVELREFAKVNADCIKRLQKEGECSFTLLNTNPFVIAEEDKSLLSASSDDDECLKDVKKRIKKKQAQDLTEECSKKTKVKVENQPEIKNPVSGKDRKKKKGKSKK